MLRLKAPAKLNWSLYVLNKRDDGYHEILTLMQCVGLYDTLSFEKSDAVELITDMEVPVEQNLVFKAAEALRNYAGIKLGAKIILTKEIPSGAGLGGGSSDAACALIGLNKLWGLGLGLDQLSAIGSGLGSDIPFFFNGPMAIAEGRGEVLTPLKVDVSYTVLLVKPAVSVPTKWAYEAISSKFKVQNSKNRDLTKIEEKINNIKFIYGILKKGDILNLRPFVHNDFEDVAIKRHSVIGELKDRMMECGAVLSVMSGSGSAVFGLFGDREGALRASEQFSPYFNRVVETLTSS